MPFEGIRTAGVIGAGLSGLATARMLLANGIDCTVFERGEELGGVWADGYTGFGVQVQKDLYEFPDWPLPPEAPDFTPGRVFRDYLAAYSDSFGVTPRIRFGAEVVKVMRRQGTEGWRLTVCDEGETRDVEFDLVVVCVGQFSSRPNVPTYSGQDEFAGEIIHNSAFKSREKARGRRVLVVGYGKSATDAALEAVEVAARTHLLVRTPYWPVPRRVLGALPIKWMLLTRMTSALLPLYQRPSAIERGVHKVARPLVWAFWRLVERVVRLQFRLGGRPPEVPGLVPSLPVELSAFQEVTMLPRPQLYKLIRSGGIALHRSEIDAFGDDGVTLRNGEQLDADLVILATGWRTDYAFLGEEVTQALHMEDDGFYLYRHLLHPDLPNLVFLGCHAITYQAILTSSLQARWLVELVKGRHRLPSVEAMRREIDAMKAWKRSWMPARPSRGAMVSLHQIHYHDELVRDMGLDPRRKRGLLAPLKELFGPYVCRDYATVVSGAAIGQERGDFPLARGRDQT